MPRLTGNPKDKILYSRSETAITTESDKFGGQVVVLRSSSDGSELNIDQNNPQKGWHHSVLVVHGSVRFDGKTHTANTATADFDIPVTGEEPGTTIKKFEVDGEFAVLVFDGKDSPSGIIRTNPAL